MRTLKGLFVAAASVAVLFSAHFAFAEFAVEDPSGVLTALKRDYGMRAASMADAFSCGEKRTFTATQARCEFRCSNMFCQSRCEDALGFSAKFDLHVEECTKDGLSIFGDNGLALTVSRSEFEADGTWLRALLRGAAHFIQPEGRWTIKNHWFADVSVLESGRLVRLPNVRSVELQLEFGVPGSQTATYFALLDLDKVGIDQLLTLGDGLIPYPGAPTFLNRRGVVMHDRGGGGIFP